MMGHLDWLDGAPNNQGPNMKLLYTMVLNYFDCIPKYHALRMKDHKDPRPFIYIVLFLEDGNNEASYMKFPNDEIHMIYGQWVKWINQYTLKELKIMRDDYIEARR